MIALSVISLWSEPPIKATSSQIPGDAVRDFISQTIPRRLIFSSRSLRTLRLYSIRLPLDEYAWLVGEDNRRGDIQTRSPKHAKPCTLEHNMKGHPMYPKVSRLLKCRLLHLSQMETTCLSHHWRRGLHHMIDAAFCAPHAPCH